MSEPFSPGPQSRSITVDGLERRYLVHIPAGEARSRPVVMMLHGSGGSGSWAAGETRWNEWAQNRGWVAVFPDATRPNPSHPALFFSNPAVWNDGAERPPSDRVSHVDDVTFIRMILDDLPRHVAIDPNRVCLTGFSNGAAMAFRLAAELPDCFCAVAPVAGHCWYRGQPSRQMMPTLYLIGDVDPLLPLEGGTIETFWAESVVKPPIRETLARWARHLGYTGSASTEIAGEVQIEKFGPGFEAWLIRGLGHHWPGGRGGLNPRLAGPWSAAVDATATIGSFFERVTGDSGSREAGDAFAKK
jgi:polyhydroxybutyrate depolymerase